MAELEGCKWLVEDARPAQSLKKAARNPGEVRAFRLQDKGPALPDALRAFRNLEVLLLRGTGLERWPSWLHELSALRALDLSGTDPACLSPGSIEILAALPRLEEIVIDSVTLPVPPALGRLSALQRLRVEGASLRQIPGGWLALSSLRCLHLAHNQITAVPAAIHGMRGLRRLSLRGNEVPVEQARALAAAMPWCEVETDAAPAPELAAAIAASLAAVASDLERHRAGPPLQRVEGPPPARANPAGDHGAPEAQPLLLRLSRLPPAPPAEARPALDLLALHALEPIQLAVGAERRFVARPAWSPDGRWLAVARPDKVLLIDTATLRPQEPVAATACVEVDLDEVISIGFAGPRLLVALGDGSVHAIDLQRGEVAWRTDPGQTSGDPTDLVCQPDHPLVVTVAKGEIRIRDHQGTLQGSIPCKGWVHVALCPARKLLVTRSGTPLRVYDIDGAPRLVAEGPESKAAALAPDGKLVFVGRTHLERMDFPGTPRAHQRYLLDAIHPALVTALTLSPQGTWAASSCEDGGVGLWQTRKLDPVRVLRGDGPVMLHASFDPGGALIATYDQEQAIHVWAPRPA